jgi:hypothetical protein
MRLLSRKLPLPQFFIDANMINARRRLNFMNVIEKWYQNGVISLKMPEDAQIEAEAGHCMNRTLKARSYIAPLPLITTAAEQRTLDLIQRLLRGSRPVSESDQRDALIVFTAVKYHGILITADGASNSQPRGILGAASELRDAVGAQIISAANAVTLIRQNIIAHDSSVRAFCQRRKVPLPSWVGTD